MSNEFTCFFPTNNNEQGWINDFVLSQARRPGSDLQKFLFSDGGLSESALAGRDNKIFSLHPKYKNQLETELRRRLDDSPADKKKAREEKEKYINFMLNISSAQLAAMSPFISLYIVRKDDFGKWNLQKKEPVRFKNTTDVNFITENIENYARGSDAGIKEVSVARRQPRFVVDNWEIEINYYFSSLAAFAKKTNGAGPGEFTAKEKRDKVKYEYINTIIEKLKEDEERLILEYGWNFNDNIEDEIIPPDIKQIIKKQEVKTLWISWKSHSFNFTERGEIELNVSYVGGPIGDMFYKERAAILPKDKFLLGRFLSKQEAKKIGELQKLYAEKGDREKRLNALRKKGIKSKECSISETKARIKAVEANNTKPARSIKEINKAIYRKETSMLSDLAGVILNTIYNNRAMFNMSVFSFTPQSGDAQYEEIQTAIKIVNSYNEDVKSSNKKSISFVSTANRVKPFTDLKTEIEAAVWKDKVVDVCKTEYNTTYEIKSTVKGAPKPGVLKADFEKFVAGVAHKGPGQGGGPTDEPGTAWRFNFFPLRALVQAVYDLAGEDAKKWPVVCFGNTIFRSVGNEVWVNIGDILVTVETFSKWLYKLIYRDRKINLPIGDLLQEITINLANEALYHNATAGISNFSLGTIRWDQYMVDRGFGPLHNNALWNLYYADHFFGAVSPKKAPEEKKALEFLVGEIKSSREVNATGEPMILVHFVPNEDSRRSSFLGTTSLVKKMFDRTNDHDLGLYHIYIGGSRGLLRNISFSHKDMEKLRSAIALQNRDSTAGFFKATYSAAANLIGNNVFPNAGVFVIPRSTLGLNGIEDPGISGYYAIHETRDSIGPGKYETSVTGTNYYSEKISDDVPDEPVYPISKAPVLAEYVAEVLMRSEYAKTHELKIIEKQRKKEK